jgi:hypothetical protein
MVVLGTSSAPPIRGRESMPSRLLERAASAPRTMAKTSGPSVVTGQSPGLRLIDRRRALCSEQLRIRTLISIEHTAGDPLATIRPERLADATVESRLKVRSLDIRDAHSLTRRRRTSTRAIGAEHAAFAWLWSE